MCVTRRRCSRVQVAGLRCKQSHYLPQHNEPVSHISSGKSRDNYTGLCLALHLLLALSLSTPQLLFKSLFSLLCNYKLFASYLPTLKKTHTKKTVDVYVIISAVFHRRRNMKKCSNLRKCARVSDRGDFIAAGFHRATV